MNLTQCFVDESIYDEIGVVVTAFIFADATFEAQVAAALISLGIDSPREEFKSRARMDTDQRMAAVRSALLDMAEKASKLAVFFGPYSRPRLGRQVLQAAQSVTLRNAHAIKPSALSIYFDQNIFPSQLEAARLHALFKYLKPCRILAAEDSKVRVGIQVADCVAHSFGQIAKAALVGKEKIIDIGGPGTGYAEGTAAPLGWALLMSLREALFTRPIVYRGESYAPECDPVVLDPEYDDPVTFGQHPVLLGWGVQVAPESGPKLRQAVEEKLGRIWLGCIH